MTNLCLSWIDYKKAYDMVPHSWLMECTTMLEIALNVREMLSNSMKSWKVELTSGGQTLGAVNIRRGIFQGDSLSPILFVIALIPLSEILRKVKMGYSLGKDGGKFNHLLFMDDLKLYGRNVNEIDSLIQTVRIFSQDIGMEFGIQKCAMLKIVIGKMVECEGISLPNGEKVRSLEKGQDYRYLGVLQCDTIKHNEMKGLLRNEYFRRVRKMLKSSLNSGNVIQAINSRAVSVIRYGAGIVDWTKNELQEMDRKTRKLLTIYRSMHPQGDVDRLYMKRVAGGRGLQSVEETVELEEASLAFYLETKEEELLREVSREQILEFNGSPQDKKKAMLKDRQMKYENRNLHGAFERKTKEIKDSVESWTWLKKGYLKKETEGMIMAAQDQAIRTRWVQKNIDKMDITETCRMCGDKEETISHIVSECKQLAQKEYKLSRHDKVAAILHWDICQKNGFECGDKSYEHVVDSEKKVLENEDVKVLWDFPIQTDKKLDHNRPDITMIDKRKKVCWLIDVACPFDTRIDKKEHEKIEAYTELKYEVLKVWWAEVQKVFIVPIIIGALGSVTKKLGKNLEMINSVKGVEPLQKACLLGTARIIRKVLDFGD